MSSSSQKQDAAKDTSAAATTTTTSTPAPAAAAATTGAASKDKTPVFPVGAAGKRELKRALVRSKDPARTIQTFQQQHSLHSMMARAFGTLPRHEAKKRRAPLRGNGGNHLATETLDTDSVMTFLSHIGVRQHEVHKRISDTLLKQLEDEIRKTQSEAPLLALLQSCWAYATAILELRPVLLAVLKQLGERTPLAVLNTLAEREESTTAGGELGELKYAEIFRPLPPLLKRLCWEADWDSRIPTSQESDQKPLEYLEQVQGTLLYQTVQPLLQQYVSNNILVEAANRPFVATIRDRKLLTTQRRALTVSMTASATSTTAPAPASVTTTTGLLRGSVAAGGGAAPNSAAGAPPSLDSGKAVAHLRRHLCDTASTTTSSTYRPKLLYAVLSILMAQHGSTAPNQVSNSSSESTEMMESSSLVAGARHLHCTLVADLLLSTGGPLSKAYQHVQSLARILDEVVQMGNCTDKALADIQANIRLIFQPNFDPEQDSPLLRTSKKQAKEKGNSDEDKKESKDDSTKKNDGSGGREPLLSNSLQRQLNNIILSGLSAMKEADPQNLFLNPVTDAIAPGYSRIIQKPMCIVNMEDKVADNVYHSIADWEADVKLMFKNCMDYNRGQAGQWFRGEASRQQKVFKDEVVPQARKLYSQEQAKRAAAKKAEEEAPHQPSNAAAAASTGTNPNKRKADESGVSVMEPLPASIKNRKKQEKDEYIPSMPALASMLLSDPFVVRIVLARTLRELQRAVLSGHSIPAAHTAVPSLLQILHMAQWSPHICAMRGKRFFVPDGGLQPTPESNYEAGADPSKEDERKREHDWLVTVPFATLRQYVPLLLRLALEADFDKRVAPNGDLHGAAQAAPIQLERIPVQAWEGAPAINDSKSKKNRRQKESRIRQRPPVPVAVALLEGTLVHLCQTGNGNEASLAVSFGKFADALQCLASSNYHDRCFWQQDRAFFHCLVHALVRHKSKLPKESRDGVVHAWLSWLRQKPLVEADGPVDSDADRKRMGSVSSPAHECLILLLNEWAAMGNLIMPRDKLVNYAVGAIEAADSSESSDETKFVALWQTMSEKSDAVKSGNHVAALSSGVPSAFAAVKQQYDRLIKILPAAHAQEFRDRVFAAAINRAESDDQHVDEGEDEHELDVNIDEEGTPEDAEMEDADEEADEDDQ